MNSAGVRVFAALQWLLPTRALSRAMHGVAGLRITWVKNLLIAGFMRLYQVDLEDAEKREASAYPSFNAFFTRSLRIGARPLPADPAAIASPVDGHSGQYGNARTGSLLQAKGAAYSVRALLGGDEALAAPFLAGCFATLYLAPANYHRVHMPVAGSLRETRYLPGRLFGVNPASVRSIPRLFTRNERLICYFDTAVGPLAVILVGAFCVGGIATAWGGAVTPPHRRRRAQQIWPAQGPEALQLQRGAELGRFNLGSTVILLFGAGAVTWSPALDGRAALRMGEAIGILQPGG